MMHQLILIIVLLVVSLTLVDERAAGQEQSLDLERIQRATVYVMQARNVSDNLFVTCVGTGTVVSRDGLILTNAHNTLVSESCPGETLVIAISIGFDEPPVPKFRAEIAQDDAGLDLALLRITRELDGRLLDEGTLALPFVELADSSTIGLDDTILVAGYPGIGDEPISTTRGTITGFLSEPRGDSRAWIKTSAVIPGIMSGGGAYNQAGQLIGIPTTAPITLQSANTTCLPIQDTNDDGLVNSNDFCIAIGGFINALRPSNFARPLLRAAALDLSVEVMTTPPSEQPMSSPPMFKRLFFSPAVNEAGMPTTTIRSLPAGSNSLYLFFDYENMTPETVYELRMTTDGRPNTIFSLAPVRWSGGERGLWYIGSSNQPWPNGVYEFTLFANGVASPTARLVVGAAPEATPTFSDIAFGLLDLRGNPLGNGFVLPAGNVASARFIFRNLQDGLEWTTIWYLNGSEIPNSRQTNAWSNGVNGTATTSIESESGLPAGRYRLELYIEDRLATTSDFTIAGAQQGAFPQIFAGEHFTTANSPEEALTAAPIGNFADRVNPLYALFDWQQIAPGTLWAMRWRVDEEIFYERTAPWNGLESGENFLIRLSGQDEVPDGTYTLELLLNNVQLARIEAQVGIGQLALDRFGQASGVQLRGRIVDADTRQGIAGVTFILISKDFSVDEFAAGWDQQQVYATAVTDSGGYFEIDRLLEVSTEENTIAYSALVAAEGYVPASADGLEVNANSENPLNIVIYLTRD